MNGRGEAAHGRGGTLAAALVTLLLAAAMLGGIALASAVRAGRTYEVTFYQVINADVSQNVRFVLLTDLHLREYGGDNAGLIADVAALAPDAILLGGDLVTYGTDGYDGMLALCRALAQIAPSFAVMGNHEDEMTFLGGDAQLPERFAQTGVTVLRNRAQTVQLGADTVEIVGVSGYGEGFERYGGRACMETLDAEHAGLRVVMAHVPTLFPGMLDAYAFDLGVAGHTHGGIVRLPVLGGLYSAEEGLLPVYDGGQHALDNGAELIVSRGLGHSGRVPRIFNLPELVVIDVNRY